MANVIPHPDRRLNPHPQTPAHRKTRLRPAALLAAVLPAATLLTGCGDLGQYFNLSNSLLDPSQVGRFDKGNLKGQPGPVKWPILESLDVVDEPAVHWTTATDPLPEDLTGQVKEYVLGPGDVISVSVFELIVPGQESVQARRINELGDINLQYVGTVHAGGLTPTQLEEKLGQILVDRRILQPKGEGQPGPQVAVTVQDARQRNFSILGTARAGTYNILASDFRLLDALALTGDVPVQPGLDYIYVIRQTPAPTGPAVPVQAVNPTTPAATPINANDHAADVLQGIEQNTATQPAAPMEQAPGSNLPPPPAIAPDNSTLPGPSSTPATGPQSSIRTTGTVILADALDAAMGGVSPATTTAPAAAPTSAAPSGTLVAPLPDNGTLPATASAPADQNLLNQAMGATSEPNTQYVYQDGKYVPVRVATSNPGTPGTQMTDMTPPSPAPTNAAGTMSSPTPALPSPSAAMAAAATSPTRIIRIPLVALREGVKRYNIVIRPGDFIVVPTVEQGLYYLMGNIARPGVYTLSGQKITLKQAIASAGGLGPLAIPRRCDLIRRIGDNEEVTVRVNLQAIFDGDQPDMYLKPNDILNVGTDAVAPFLNITRNAYRLSYGAGFVYDTNFAPTNRR